MLKANRKILLSIAGIIWSFAGWRVLSIGYKDLILNTHNPWVYFMVSAVVFYAFFKYIFGNMVKKHTKRIMSSPLSKNCIFSFFDLKGYIIMIIMIGGGVTLRNAQVINPVYLGTFYLGLGTALALAGIKFLQLVLNFKSLQFAYEK